jgi:hypothetical protein
VIALHALNSIKVEKLTEKLISDKIQNSYNIESVAVVDIPTLIFVKLPRFT